MIASWQYIRQKRVDRRTSREKEIIDNLVLLQEKINYSLFILNRMVNTKNLIDLENKVKTFLEALEKHEIPRPSNALNEDILYLDMKIAILLDLYFEKKLFGT